MCLVYYYDYPDYDYSFIENCNGIYLTGGSGDDTLEGGAGCDTLDGSYGNDLLIGKGHKDALAGGAGDDTLLGGAARDSLFGNSGNDVLKGGASRDILNGGTGDDTLVGGAGSDTLNGDTGNDVLKGGAAKDYLNGGAGDDTLIGGAGRNILKGGEGNDIYVASDDNSLNIYLDNGFGPDNFDIIDASNVTKLKLQSYFLDSGIDEINGNPEGTIITGNKTESYEWNFSNIILNNIKLIKGRSGDDSITGSIDADKIKGAGNDDTLAGGSGNDTLKGGPGKDILYGNSGEDLIKGGKGSDFLEGDTGSDTLIGGSGSDDFYFTSTSDGEDLVNDFDHAEGDRLLFNGGNSAGEFQWGLQTDGVTRANTVGDIGNGFFLSGSNLTNLMVNVQAAASALFTTTNGTNSRAYYFGFAEEKLYYFGVTESGTHANIATTVTIAQLNDILGIGSGLNQITASDIILI